MSEFVIGTRIRVIEVDSADECMGLHVGDTGIIASEWIVGFGGISMVLIEWDTEHPFIEDNSSRCYIRQIEEVE